MEPSHKEPVIKFVPANVSSRHDGWTAERQIAFIEALAETACVEHACRAVGMSDSAAYKLRRSTRGALFREAWDSGARLCASPAGAGRTVARASRRPRPVFHKGKQVGEWRDYDERLTMFLLKNRRPARFGKWMDKLLPPVLPMQDDADYDLDDKLEQIENNSEDFEDAPLSRTRVEE